MSNNAITALATKKDERPVFEFDLPQELVALQDPFVKKSIGLVKLKMSEEIQASEKASGNQAKLGYNWARYSLVEVDGRRLDKSVGEDESVLENTDPMIRELVLAAYGDISVTDKTVEKKFLATRRMKV
jgi:hypothetical protein